MAGAVKAVDRLSRPAKLKFPRRERQKRRVIRQSKPVVRSDSIHYDFGSPFIAFPPWVDQEGGGNAFTQGPTINGDTGEMLFTMTPGTDRSGSMACWLALGVQLNVAQQAYSTIDFSVITSLNWWYDEMSWMWREARGEIWIGQYADLYDQNGAFLYNAIATQNRVASFDDRNYAGHGHDQGSTTDVPGLQASVPVAGSWGGGMIDYRCWIGGSGNADGTNGQSSCSLSMDAVCSSLVIDIFW
jgi:hypothetical protein